MSRSHHVSAALVTRRAAVSYIQVLKFYPKCYDLKGNQLRSSLPSFASSRSVLLRWLY